MSALSRERKQCFFHGWPEAGPCDGRLIRAHLIRRQVLKRELNAGRRLLEDPRLWVWCCGGPTGCSGHHGMLDVARTLRIPRERLPAVFEAACAELGLGWWVEREYGPVLSDAA
jgi:hypothetical protein